MIVFSRKLTLIVALTLALTLLAGFGYVFAFSFFKKNKDEVIGKLSEIDVCFALTPVSFDVSDVKLPQGVKRLRELPFDVWQFNDFNVAKVLLEELRIRYKVKPYLLCLRDESELKSFIRATKEYEAFASRVNDLVSEVKWGSERLSFESERFDLDVGKVREAVALAIGCLESKLGLKFNFKSHEKNSYKAGDVLNALYELQALTRPYDTECKVGALVSGFELIKKHDRSR